MYIFFWKNTINEYDFINDSSMEDGRCNLGGANRSEIDDIGYLTNMNISDQVKSP